MKKKQTEMPWTTAKKLAREIIIGALASELRNSARLYKRAIALRKEFKEHGIKWMGNYDGKTYDDLGRCPVCYKSGEQMGSWAVCREHNVRWLLNIGQLERHQPHLLDPEQKEFLVTLREVSPLKEPPRWFGDDLFDRMRFTFEIAFINAVMDHEWADKIENCRAQFLAVCWIVRVEFKVHRLRDGFSVSNALLLSHSLPAFIGHNFDKIGEGPVL